MSLQALSDYTIYSRYSKYLKNKKRRETWAEMVDRVFDMHATKFAEVMGNEEFKKEFEFAKKMVLKKRVLGSQRALQYGGAPILAKNERIFNCSSLYIDRPKAFQDVVFLLLAGCGVGFSVQKQHVNKLPGLHASISGEIIHQVADSVEGWADAVGVLLSSYFIGGGEFPAYEGKEVVFDFSLVRPKGSLIAGQFKAPGPEPLKKGLEKIRVLLNKAVKNGDRQLRAIQVYDILMHSSDFVISGGLRRSATICLFSKDDNEMLTAKTGNWFIDNPQRGRSNNSVVLKRDEITKEEFDQIFESIRSFGEPGFFFVDDLGVSTNPCFTKDTRVLTTDGWRSFDKLIGTKPTIIQDNRVIGQIDQNGVESWTINLKSPNVGVENIATEVGMTAQNQEIFELTLHCGRKVKATANHHFATESGMTELKNLKIGDRILVGLPKVADIDQSSAAFKSGQVLGVAKNFAIKNDSEWLFDQSKDFKAGYLSGLLLPAGAKTALSSNKTIADFYGASAQTFRVVQLLLQELGIYSRITTSKKRTRIIIPGKENHGRMLLTLVDRNLPHPHPKKSIEFSKVVQIVSVGREDVYCLKEAKRRTLIANGMTARRCVEIGFYPQLPTGETGVAFCNLSEINGRYADTKENFFLACRASAIIGTMQSAYDSFPYLGKATEQIVKHERLLGCSITGWMDNPQVLFDKDILEQGARIILETNEKIAKLIGVNPSARVTCAKPAGSTSCVLSTASGIHPHHARKYIRRVQANQQEFPLQHYKKINPLAVEESVWSANKTDDVISFACEVPKGAIVKNDIKAIELLEKVRIAQQHWVLAGNVPSRSLHPTVTHNISNTISVLDNEWDSVRDYIFENRRWFAGISLLSASGDLDYQQAPFTTILDEKELVQTYGPATIFASGLIVDGLAAFADNLWNACDFAMGLHGAEKDKLMEMPFAVEPTKPKRSQFKNEKLYGNALANYAIELNLFYQSMAEIKTNNLKRDWVRRFHQFSNRYFNGDLKKTAYCLKHVASWKQYVDLKRETKDVDWSSVVEDVETHDDADKQAAVACSGGSCELK